MINQINQIILTRDFVLERLAGVRGGLGDHLHVGEEAGAEVRLGGGCGLVAVLGGGVALAQEGAPEVPRLATHQQVLEQ